MSRQKTRFFIVLVLAMMALTGAQSLLAANVFYESMLDEGSVAFEQGAAETALKKLDIACFGFLEEPTLLAKGLAYKLMAHDAMDDLPAIRATFDRLDEIEAAFEAVTQAELSEETRQRFEEVVIRRISDRRLASSSFRPLVVAKIEEELESLPPKRKRAELEIRAQEDPSNARWPVRLAALELADGRSEEALAWADQAVALGENLPCLRGVALADLKRDEEAVVALARCPEVGARQDWTAAALRAHTRLDQWDEAAALLDRTDPAVLEDRDIERIAKRVRRKAGSEEEQEQPTDSSNEPLPVEEEGEQAESTPEPPAPVQDEVVPEPKGLSADEQSDLQEARAKLRSARRIEELHSAAEIAEPIAERHADSQEAQLVAGEIAYRSARWEDASRYFQRAGDPGDSRPALLFYMAVSFFESGEIELARHALARCLPNLHRTPYVDGYIERIAEAE